MENKSKLIGKIIQFSGVICSITAAFLEYPAKAGLAGIGIFVLLLGGVIEEYEWFD